MSVATNANGCPFLEKTKKWFTDHFQEDWNEDLWKSIGLADLVKEGRDSFIGRIVSVLLQAKLNFNWDLIVRYAGELFALLIMKEPEKGGDKKLVHLEKQFNVEYKGQVQKKLMRMINCYYDKWVKTRFEWHSPYLSIVQSSGFGKSRACKEIATTTFPENKNWLSFFICCRDSTWTGYPPQTKLAVVFFNSLLDMTPSDAVETTTRWIKWLVYFRFVFRLAFLKCMSKGNDDLKETLQTTVQDATEKEINSLLKDLQISKIENMKSDYEEESMERQAFWSLCFETCHQNLLKQMFSFIDRNVNAKTEPGMFREMVKNKRTLVVVDEARFLLNSKLTDHSDYTLFRILRSALQGFEEGIFAVVVDTHSQIANFAPSRHLDPSLRFAGNQDGRSTDLFHPFTAVITTDVLCDPNSNLDLAKNRFILGRPLWKTSLDQFGTSFTRLNEFALHKLFGGIVPPDDTGKIACIAVLTGINILPISTIARNLVASHMATCLAIDSDRESLLIAYPVEPVLAEAAKMYVKKEHDCKQLFKVFEPLQSCFRLGVIDRGQNGELVAKIIILLGMFQASDAGTVTILCETVLNALFGDNFIKGSKGKISLQDEFSFNCFTQIFRSSKYWKESDAQAELASFFNRGAAIQMPCGHIGADLLLPIRRKSRVRKRVSRYSYFYLLVQVKNYKRNVCSYVIEKCTKMLDRTFEEGTSWAKSNIGYSIIMNVGQEKEKSYWHGQTSIGDEKSKGRKRARPVSSLHSKHFVVTGIGVESYPTLFNDQPLLIDALSKMLREPSFDEWITHSVAYPEGDQKHDFSSLCPITL